jgi:hypothetical protein
MTSTALVRHSEVSSRHSERCEKSLFVVRARYSVPSAGSPGPPRAPQPSFGKTLRPRCNRHSRRGDPPFRSCLPHPGAAIRAVKRSEESPFDRRLATRALPVSATTPIPAQPIFGYCSRLVTTHQLVPRGGPGAPKHPATFRLAL